MTKVLVTRNIDQLPNAWLVVRVRKTNMVSVRLRSCQRGGAEATFSIMELAARKERAGGGGTTRQQGADATLYCIAHTAGSSGTRNRSGQFASETRQFRASHLLALLWLGPAGMAAAENAGTPLRDLLGPLLRVEDGEELTGEELFRGVFPDADPASWDTVGDAAAQLDRDLHEERTPAELVALGRTHCSFRPEQLHADAARHFGLRGVVSRVFMPNVRSHTAKFWHLRYGLYRFFASKKNLTLDSRRLCSSFDMAGYQMRGLVDHAIGKLNAAFEARVKMRRAGHGASAGADDRWRDRVEAFRRVYEEGPRIAASGGAIASAFITNTMPPLSSFQSSPAEGAIQDVTQQSPTAAQNETFKVITSANKRETALDHFQEGNMCKVSAIEGQGVGQTGWMSCGAIATLDTLYPEGRLPGAFLEPAGFVPPPRCGAAVPPVAQGCERRRVLYGGLFVGWVDVLPNARAAVLSALRASALAEARRLLDADASRSDPRAWELACVTFAWRTVPAARRAVGAPGPQRDVDLHISTGRGRLVVPLLVRQHWDTPEKVERVLNRVRGRLGLLDMVIRGLVEMADMSAYAADGPVVGTVYELLSCDDPARRAAITHLDVHPSLRMSYLTSTLVDSTHDNRARELLAQHQKKAAGRQKLQTLGWRFSRSMGTSRSQRPLVTTATERTSLTRWIRPANHNISTAVAAFEKLENEDGNIVAEGKLNGMAIETTQAHVREARRVDADMRGGLRMLEAREEADEADRFNCFKTLRPGVRVDRGDTVFESVRHVDNQQVTVWQARGADGGQAKNRSCGRTTVMAAELQLRRLQPARVRRAASALSAPPEGDEPETPATSSQTAVEVIGRVALMELIFPGWGDKWSTAHAQKGTLAVVPQIKLPHFIDGTVPTAITAAQNTAQRNTIGSLFTSAACMAHAWDMSLPAGARDERDRLALEHLADRTAFTDDSCFAAVLEGFSQRRAGHPGQLGKSTLYSADDNAPIGVLYAQTARTAEEMSVGSTGVGVMEFYMVDHRPADKAQCCATGVPSNHLRRGKAIDPKTGAPLRGRRRNGALRFSEMDIMALAAHGLPSAIADIMMHGDANVTPFCKECNKPADALFAPCGYCLKNGREVYPVSLITRTSVQFLMQLNMTLNSFPYITTEQLHDNRVRNAKRVRFAEATADRRHAESDDDNV